MPATLTSRQSEILAFIRSRPTPPSVREIGRAMGIRSTNGVACHLDALRRKGALLPSERGKCRTIRAAGPVALVRLCGAIDSSSGRVAWRAAL